MKKDEKRKRTSIMSNPKGVKLLKLIPRPKVRIGK